MSIDLKLPSAEESIVVKFKLPKDVADAFQLYVQAAQEQTANADESLVLATLLRHHIKKDRGFRDWLKSHTAKSKYTTKDAVANPKITAYESREVA